MSETGRDSRVGSQIGRYRLKRLLGKGGMGEVYEAEDTVKDRVVALKLLPEAVSHDPMFRKRLQREAQSAGRLQEPHVVPIHDYGEIDGLLYVDMRLIDGTDLRKSLKRWGPMAPARAVAIVRQVASALDAAHEAGVIHRDVKPENIVVTRDDFAYLLDFGIANATTDTRLTEMGSAVGTYAYMAPERFTSDEVTYRADIYALASVLYECLVGAQPYSGDSVSVVITAHLMQPVPRPSEVRPGIPKAFDDVVARGMAKKPGDRYVSAGELAQAANDALTSPDQDKAATILRRSDAATLPGLGAAADEATSRAAHGTPPPTAQPQAIASRPPAGTAPSLGSGGTPPPASWPPGGTPPPASWPPGGTPPPASRPSADTPPPALRPSADTPPPGPHPVSTVTPAPATMPAPRIDTAAPIYPSALDQPTQPAWTSPTPPPVPQPVAAGQSRRWIPVVVVAVVLILLLIGLGIWWTGKQDSSSHSLGPTETAPETSVVTQTTTPPTKASTPTSIVPPPATTTSAAADQTVMDTKLLGLLPHDYADGACQAVHPPIAGALATVDCGQSKTADGSTLARYSLYPDVATLNKNFTEAIASDSVLLRCPGLSVDSPTTWHYTATPDKVEGQLSCGVYNSKANLVWTRESDLVLGAAQGNDKTSLHNWWSKYA